MWSRWLAGSAVLGLVVAGSSWGAGEITTESLLKEMTDLKGLAEFPDPPFTCRQFSSYDRKSKSPSEDWFANADSGQYLRIEERQGRKEHVMMDAAGPGAIVRIWSANPKGVLRIYLDGGEQPALEAPMADLLGGRVPGFPKPIAHEVSRGWNSYLPIPYARHCKVTSDEGGFYYHVNYRTYPPGTPVRTFTKNDLDELKELIGDVARKLASPREGGGPPADRDRQLFEVTLEPGQTRTVQEIEGGKAICGFLVRAPQAHALEALRQTLVRMTFDGYETVEAPIGDFFGAAPGVNPYESLPLGVTKEGQMWSHWYMPFRRGAKVEFRNLGSSAVTLSGGISTVPYRWTPNTMLFHAKWRSEFDVPTRPMRDWNYLTARGAGTFVGVAFAIANPVKNWWGEGDEKIYVDGETFPSHFGTGTEDYYGYAWCCNVPFVHAYHNQPRCDGPGNFGHTSVNRWHVLDRIPFTKDFRFDMELWHSHAEARVNMSVVAYWYGRPGATDTFRPLEAADVRIVPLPEYKSPRVEGAIEGEKMKIVEKTGNPAPQAWDGLSDEHHLWWTGAKPGDRLVLEFQAPEAGMYKVVGRFVKAGDYGIVRLSINGKAIEPIDFYHDGVILTRPLELGTFELKAGANRLTAEIVGANEKAIKSYMFGLDYILLKLVK